MRSDRRHGGRVVVMLDLGNETEKPVVDARLRMSRVGRPIQWDPAPKGVGGASRAAHGSRSPAGIAKQATAAVTSICERSKRLDTDLR